MSPNYSQKEIIQKSIRIFQFAIDHDPGECGSQRPPQTDTCPEMDEKFHRRMIMNALREGEIMAEQKDHRYVKIFEVLSWGALLYDSEWLAEFEEMCRALSGDPQGLLEEGKQILKNALFRRRPPGQPDLIIRPSSN